MSAKDGGVPFADKVKELESKTAPNSVTMPQPDAAHREQAEQFPTDALNAPDKRDDIMSLKAALSDGQTGATPLGQMKLSDKDLQWIVKKQKEAEEANFQQWFALEFDRMSPADKQAAKQLFPDFYNQRKKLIRKQAKNLASLARIRVTGPESLKDLMYLWLVDQGRLDLGALQNIMTPSLGANDNDSSQTRFVRGLFNPARPQPKTSANMDFRGAQVQNWDANGAARTPGTGGDAFGQGMAGVGFGNYAALNTRNLVNNTFTALGQ